MEKLRNRYAKTFDSVSLADTSSGGGVFLPKGFDEGVRLWDVRWQE